MMHRILLGVFLGLSTLAVAPGCGGSDSNGAGGSAASTASPGVGEHQEKLITAATGGTVEGTGVSLAIPAGALSADTTITVDIKSKSGYADSDNIAVNVFELGPNGTQFAVPVPLTLDLYDAKAPSGKVAKIAYYDGSAWKALPDSVVSGGKITATTTHFTAFTVVWENGQQTGGGCASLAFTPCGGDLTGTWKFAAGCADVPPVDPTDGKCPEATTATAVDFSGTITFNADNTYAVDMSQSSSRTITLPASCVDALGGASACTSEGGTIDGSGACAVTESDTPKTTSETGSYTTSDNTFTTTSAGGSPDNPLSYCVTGATLKAMDSSNGTTVIYTATKQ
jgi:hypothetical protein